MVTWASSIWHVTIHTINGQKCVFYVMGDTPPVTPTLPSVPYFSPPPPSPIFDEIPPTFGPPPTSATTSSWSAGPPILAATASMTDIISCTVPTCNQGANKQCTDFRTELLTQALPSSQPTPTPYPSTQPEAYSSTQLTSYPFTQLGTNPYPSTQLETNPYPSTQPTSMLSSQALSSTALSSTACQPRFCMHLAAEAAEERCELETKWQTVCKELDNAKGTTEQLNSTVVLFAWVEEAEPMPVEVQGIVVNTKFVITAEILHWVGIEELDFHYYHYGASKFSAVRAPYTLKLNHKRHFKWDGSLALILHSRTVKKCEGLDKLLMYQPPSIPMTLLAQPEAIQKHRQDLLQELAALDISSTSTQNKGRTTLQPTTIHTSGKLQIADSGKLP
ncbi:hypothetical protein K435DRAFT_857983 [Dendrothele bispora CBS 962.96]|uniref:Uncharacterized protein n=1 Tax=Dendrothele bispora (strain CBS 962.96) TaxID=1314807 RepID=A0A4S8M529_DENBC|nr:hypothetical protein K435DRAFT_857983 [Dendrothele bispora CBS 962.96]